MAGLRLATATATTACTALRIGRGEMIGTTRSRVSFFMNRFRELGFIEFNGRIKAHKSLLNAALLDRLSEPNPNKPPSSATARTRSKPARSAKLRRN
jgi:hypothetical protein